MSRYDTPVTEQLGRYIAGVSLRQSDVLRRLREEVASYPNSSMQISAEQGQFLQLLIRMLGAKRTLEIGVFTGYSSLSVVAVSLKKQRIVGCDVSEPWTSVARRYWREAGVEGKIELHLAPAVETLDRLLAEGAAGSFDFAFIDADKLNYDNYYERCLELVRRGGLIAVDNTLWHGRVVDDGDQTPDTLAIRAFNDKLHEDQRIWLSLVPIGDGLTLALKK